MSAFIFYVQYSGSTTTMFTSQPGIIFDS